MIVCISRSGGGGGGGQGHRGRAPEFCLFLRSAGFSPRLPSSDSAVAYTIQQYVPGIQHPLAEKKNILETSASSI